MNRLQFAKRIAALEEERVAFAVATVVARRSPVSAHLADRALVLADGRMEGFVGGSCAREIVRKQALRAIQGDVARLLQIRPLSDPQPAASIGESEVVRIPMGCSSEGSADIFIEPHVPAPHLFIIGFTPVAEALARIAAVLDTHHVVRVVSDTERPDLEPLAGVRDLCLREFAPYLAQLHETQLIAGAAVIASQGHYDEAALEVLLRATPLAYISLLASRKRARAVFGALAQVGLAAERIDAVRNPAGIDIGARRPGDVAVSILAELVAHAPAAAPVEIVEAATARDPICGMDVEITDDAHRADYDGTAYYFCCAGCRAAFLENPAAHLNPSVS